VLFAKRDRAVPARQRLSYPRVRSLRTAAPVSASGQVAGRATP
jgi:hypothetical protein